MAQTTGRFQLYLVKAAKRTNWSSLPLGAQREACLNPFSLELPWPGFLKANFDCSLDPNSMHGGSGYLFIGNMVVAEANSLVGLSINMVSLLQPTRLSSSREELWVEGGLIVVITLLQCPCQCYARRHSKLDYLFRILEGITLCWCKPQISYSMAKNLEEVSDSITIFIQIYERVRRSTLSCPLYSYSERVRRGTLRWIQHCVF